MHYRSIVSNPANNFNLQQFQSEQPADLSIVYVVVVDNTSLEQSQSDITIIIVQLVTNQRNLTINGVVYTVEVVEFIDNSNNAQGKLSGVCC
jgi:hypothetical protein